jgi:hypothetical protein
MAGMDENPYQSPQATAADANPTPWLREILTDSLVGLLVALAIGIPAAILWVLSG